MVYACVIEANKKSFTIGPEKGLNEHELRQLKQML